MTTAMPKPLERLLKLFSGAQTQAPTERAMDDTTLYKIETQTNQYHGRIVNQDNVAIILLTNQGKSVKILKENVRSITIDKNKN